MVFPINVLQIAHTERFETMYNKNEVIWMSKLLVVDDEERIRSIIRK